MPYSSRAGSLWDAQAVLKIDNMGRCAGWARSCHRNCANPIARHNQQKADNLIDVLDTKTPDFDLLEDDLYDLAGLLLCRRVHQDQADDIVGKWKTRLDHFAASQIEEEEAPRRRRQASGRALILGTTNSSSRAVSGPSRPSDLPAPSLFGSVQSIPVTMYQLPQPQYSEARPTDSSNSQEIAIATLQARVTEILDRLSARSGERTPESSTSPEPRRTTAAASSAPSTSSESRRLTDTTPSTPACTTRHARRLAIDDCCPICHDDFLLRDRDRLVWCKSGCGRTVHQDCFETWEKACQDGDRTVTCGICRTPWSQDCDCES